MIKNKNTIYTSLFIIIVLQYIFVRYNGSFHSLFMYNLKFYAYDFFLNDLYLQNSLSIKTSILYPILKFTKINFENDFVGFFIHLNFSIFNGFIIFQIIKKHLNIKILSDILLISIVLIVCDNFFIEANRGSWIISHTNSPTYFAKTFCLLSVYLLLEKKIFLAILSLSLTLLFHVKVGWVLVPIFFLFLSVNNNLRKKLFIMILPLLCLLYLAGKESLIGSFEIKKYLFEIAVERDGIEGSFKFQPIYKNISLFISFFIFFFLNQKEEGLKKFNYVILLVSSGLFVFNIIYVEYIGIFLPDPRVIIIGMPRALELYETFFWLLVFKKILNLKKDICIKIFLITGLFFLLIFTKKSLIISLIIFILTLFIFLILKVEKTKNMIFYLNKNVYFICFFLILLGSSYSFIKDIKYNFNSYAFKKTGKWTTQYLNNDYAYRLDSALSLKSCDDFILVDVDVSNKATNYVSNKSRLFGNVHYNYLNIKFIEEHFLREKIKKEIYLNVDNRVTFSNELVEKLNNYKLSIISREKITSLFNMDNKIFLNNKDVITVFNDSEFQKIKKCLNII